MVHQIVQVLANFPSGTHIKLSFVGHSLGGLYARVAAGLLQERGYFSERLEPIVRSVRLRLF